MSSAIKRLLFPTRLVSSLDSPTFFIIEKNSNQFLLQKKKRKTQFTISRSAERTKGIPIDSQTASLKRKNGRKKKKKRRRTREGGEGRGKKRGTKYFLIRVEYRAFDTLSFSLSLSLPDWKPPATWLIRGEEKKETTRSRSLRPLFLFRVSTGHLNLLAERISPTQKTSGPTRRLRVPRPSFARLRAQGKKTFYRSA